MKMLGVLALFFILGMVGCGDCFRYDRAEFRHARREARREMWEARDEFRRSMRDARDELRRNIQDARDDWHDRHRHHHWRHDWD
jgi:hypothetical protein